LTNNFDLKVAAARFDTANANRRNVDAARYPRVDVGANASHRRISSANNLFGDEFNNYALDINLVWELDVWGKLKNRTQAAIADAEAQAATYRAAELSLAANTIKFWFNTVEAQLLVELAEETLQVFEDNLIVVEGSYKRGLPNRALDVRLTRANVEGARSTLEFRRRLRDSAGRSLEVFLGRYPADALSIATNLPALNTTVPPGLPSDLLQRRPDIVAAERRLASSMERVKFAKKEMLPTIALTSSTGAASGDLRELLDMETLFWNVAGNLTQPVFQGGQIRAGIDLADANSRQFLAAYSQSVLVAFQEVETFLAAEDYLHREKVALRKAVEESVAAEDLAWQQYQRGLVDIITVLESQRRSFNARSSSINVVNDRLQNRINLYLALGGDFGLLTEMQTARIGPSTNPVSPP